MAFFQKELNIITSYEEGKISASVDEYRQALFFMSFITGIDAKAGYSSTIGYNNREDYEKNVQDWKAWYKKNKRNLTDQYEICTVDDEPSGLHVFGLNSPGDLSTCNTVLYKNKY